MFKYNQKETELKLIILIFVLWKMGLSYYLFQFTCSLRQNCISYSNYPFCMNTSKSITRKIILYPFWISSPCIILATTSIKAIKTKTWNCLSNLRMVVLVLPLLHFFRKRLSLKKDLISSKMNHLIITLTKSFHLPTFLVFGNRQSSFCLKIIINSNHWIAWIYKIKHISHVNKNHFFFNKE